MMNINLRKQLEIVRGRDSGLPIYYFLFPAFLLLLLTFPTAVFSQLAIKAQLNVWESAQPFTVGDPIALTLTIDHPRGYRLIPPSYTKTWGELELIKWETPTITLNKDGTETTSQALTAVGWRIGSWKTADLLLQLSDPDGKLVTILPQPAEITIESVISTEEDTLRDLKPQAALPFPRTRLYIVGGGLIIALITGLIVGRWIGGRLKPEPVVAAIVDDRPPYLIALTQLEEIAAQNLPSQQRYKEHYTLSADVVRHYLLKQFDVPAIDLTTYELQNLLRERDQLPATLQVQLRHLLQHADLVKFAKFSPDEQSAEELLAQARSFIEASRPQ